jgi:cell wall assembly regulator SMI1
LIFKNCESPLSTAEVSAIETALGLQFPKPLRDHYLRWNGGSPEPYVYEDERVDTVVSEALPLKSERGTGTAVQTYRSLVIEKSLTPPTYFPFAVDGAGDYFFVDCSSEGAQVYFYASDNDEGEKLISLKLGLEDFWLHLKEE